MRHGNARAGDHNSPPVESRWSKPRWRKGTTTVASHAGENRCLSLQPHAAKIHQFYNSPEITARYARRQSITPCERLIFAAYIKPGMAILDIGVGTGRTTEYLAKDSSRYVGIDYAPAMLEVCRNKHPQLEYFVDSATDLSRFQCGSFDVVVMCFNTLDDVIPDENRQRCLRECHRVLRDQGLLIFSSHNPRAIIVRPNWQCRRDAAFRQLAGRPSNSFLSYSPGLAEHVATILSAIKLSLHRISRYAWTVAFWRGKGHMVDAHKLRTHYWIPAEVIRELTRAGFQCNTVKGDDYPLKSHILTTEWYYYVFSKV
jgi:ubiquinone/menaquinone biosynthesis C-methylase UbiE